MMFLINISSNHRAKFFIGTTLTQLSELGDMYVSEVFASNDRQGSETLFYNSCVMFTTELSIDKVIQQTKEIESNLGRNDKNIENQVMPVDIDVLAYKQTEQEAWSFLETRLPLTADVQAGLQDLEINLDTVTIQTVVNKPVQQTWWDDE